MLQETQQEASPHKHVHFIPLMKSSTARHLSFCVAAPRLRKPTLMTQVAKSTESFTFNLKERFWVFVVWLKTHITLDKLEVDELLLAQRQQIPGDDGPSTFERNRG